MIAAASNHCGGTTFTLRSLFLFQTCRTVRPREERTKRRREALNHPPLQDSVITPLHHGSKPQTAHPHRHQTTRCEHNTPLISAWPRAQAHPQGIQSRTRPRERPHSASASVRSIPGSYPESNSESIPFEHSQPQQRASAGSTQPILVRHSP
ncbi:hypothetical protein M440DRAFT_1084934 [Trichoderma longibrachiatum ATCC 18648]|uniref:Uncharacterized protein n=1 Tax=Trichoderma longibrachiatum ATCC 18648 TaxID=983965 RepID=A0A2T4BU47_TRILO|nr:hypothetical protein M440DRAFT_1084934 [Trichoderma longibrachiatum ATCC 18648]